MRNQAVTVLGLGPMGQALAGTFLAAGHPTTVWNRTAAKADELVERGATRAATVTDAIGLLVIVCLQDDDAVHEVLDPVAGVLKGRTVIDLTSASPAQARTTAAGAGLDHIIQTARERRLDTGALTASKAVVQRAIDAGHGGAGLSALVDAVGHQEP